MLRGERAASRTIADMTSPYWPLAGLRLRTPRLELRWPTLADLDALAGLAEEGVHDPAVMPFGVAWTDAPPAERARGTLLYNWAQWGAWKPEDWTLDLVADLDGDVVGMQGMSGCDFAILREVNTGSWLGRRFQGQGIGTQMRAAVLALAFEGLGAEYATSEAHSDNPASQAVSRKLGYADDGILRRVVRGQAVRAQRFRIDREAWQAHRSIPVEICGLEPCLPSFGLTG
jgi:RimJ/RimL family protein N-acetyltransferase